MKMKGLVIVLFLVLFISVQSSNGIRCWVCDTVDYSNCGLDFDSTGMNATDCGGDFSCIITTVTTAGNIAVTRVCGGTKMTEGCTTTTVEDVTAEVCYCNTDECFAAPDQATNVAPGGLEAHQATPP